MSLARRVARRGSTPNEVAFRDNLAILELGDGAQTIIERKDYHLVGRYHWRVTRAGRTSYASTTDQNGRTLFLHRVLVRPRGGLIVDHINGDGLDNRLENLQGLYAPAEHAEGSPAQRRVQPIQGRQPPGWTLVRQDLREVAREVRFRGRSGEGLRLGRVPRVRRVRPPELPKRALEVDGCQASGPRRQHMRERGLTGR